MSKTSKRFTLTRTFRLLVPIALSLLTLLLISVLLMIGFSLF